MPTSTSTSTSTSSATSASSSSRLGDVDCTYSTVRSQIRQCNWFLLSLAIFLACLQVFRVAHSIYSATSATTTTSTTALLHSNSTFKSTFNFKSNLYEGEDDHEGDGNGENENSNKDKIAILLSMVPSKMWNQKGLDHAKANLNNFINKACYAKLWNYDLIVNTTNAFQEYTYKRPWLHFGAWNRVPHMQALMDSKKYSWILYGDHDMLIHDMTKPIESMLKEVHLYGKQKSASAFIPVDTPGKDIFDFSSFAIMLQANNNNNKNQVARNILKYWMKFAMGLCPKGNYPPPAGEENFTHTHSYDWQHSDQPGLWYSLAKTHQEYNYYLNNQHNNNHSSSKNNNTYDENSPDLSEIGECNKETGYLSHMAHAFYLGKYFQQAKVVKGTGGPALANVPKNQSILWSLFDDNEPDISLHSDTLVSQRIGNGPFAINTLCCGQANKLKGLRPPFAIHTKFPSNNWPGDMPLQLQQCKQNLGCFANLTNDGFLTLGCADTLYFSGRLFQ
ncbi:expressed unknown protein [Seminavis robusta]|uniref:Nucleotide-diphospho-sugar transferase domain-containing protein n=1 Tax=Seminavis robusta TaxID=568900 RepID=A0A9N8H0W2_9STRA|nr:expressed unknown protein [Seminavis robusta]|eukprot:Sro28_g018600.1 n/a (504) ;mRNA; r:37010-38521